MLRTANSRIPTSSRKRPLIISDRARQDYDDILIYTAETWGQRQADTYDAAIDRSLREPITYPHRGRPRNEIFPGCRSRLVKHHQIFYELIETDIHILRILHERADPVRHLQR